MISRQASNTIKMILFTALLGAVAGAVTWAFLKAVSVCTELIWGAIPVRTGLPFLMIPVCAAGGLAAGLLRKRCGDYPEDLQTVMGKVKKNKYYDYRPILVILISAFLPLVFGSSVGPEAGLTGVITALCYWIGDNVTYAKNHASLFSQMGEAVTLGQLFHAPLFGILMVEEEPGLPDAKTALSKAQKFLLYGISTAAALLTAGLLGHFFGKAMEGFPRFSEVTIEAQDYVLLLVYIPVGFLLFLFFEFCEKLTKAAAERIPAVVREMICGAVIGLAGILLPMVIFSGEEQMGELMTTFGAYTPWFLIGFCLLKILMTAFCIRFGLKGGHFFPLIFACTCMGFGLAGLFFAESAGHVVFAAGIVTAATLGAQLKKPLAVTLLMLLCFPVTFLFWGFLAAAVGGFLGKLVEKRKHREKNIEV